MKRLIRDEKGYILILALLVLLVVGLVSGPVLSYMVSGLRAGHVDETGAAELYAADAGAEDAMLKLQNQVDEVKYLYCGQGNHTYPYDMADVNSKPVAVTITWVQNVTNGVMYCINSTATSSGSKTKITAYVSGVSKYGDYAGLLNQIVTTQGTIDEAKKVYLYPPSGPNGPVENYTGAWPKPSELEDFYWQDVKNVTAYGSGTIDLNGSNMTLGPLYRNGTLTISNSDNKEIPTLKLTGTLYITGDTQICYGSSQNQEMILDLNGNTIFVASNSSDPQYALKIGDKCDIKGPGCIIAIGDIYFKPNSQIGTNPVFVLSVSGTTLLQPNGNIYGAIAGSVEVDLQPGTSLTYPTGGFGDSLNFLTGIQKLVYNIASWQVSRL